MPLFYFLRRVFFLVFLSFSASCFGQSPEAVVQFLVNNSTYRPHIEVRINKITASDFFTLVYTFLDEGKPIASDSLNLPNTESPFFDQGVLHRIASPACLRAFIFRAAVYFGGKKVGETALKVPQSPENCTLVLENLTAPSRLTYAKVTDSLRLRSPENQTAFIYQIKEEFWAAAPPMATSARNISPQMDAKLVFEIPTNQAFLLKNPGLFFMQTDTSSNQGLGIRVTPADFPKFRKIKHLPGPMRYISTVTETNLRQGKPEKLKKALDRFWLKIGGEPKTAKQIIRQYFQRTSYANHAFTDYKQGWKTDRGIIYIIFGKPDQIRHSPQSIQWLYKVSYKTEPLVFTFLKRKNQFTGEHYELLRHKVYRPDWNAAVERWRNGTVNP